MLEHANMFHNTLEYFQMNFVIVAICPLVIYVRINILPKIALLINILQILIIKQKIIQVQKKNFCNLTGVFQLPFLQINFNAYVVRIGCLLKKALYVLRVVMLVVLRNVTGKMYQAKIYVIFNIISLRVLLFIVYPV